MQSHSNEHNASPEYSSSRDKIQGEQVIAELIATHYDLGEVDLPTVPPRLHQRRHRKWMVSTDAGPFLVKTYHNDPVVIDALHFQHRLAQHLAENRLPVASIQAARNGKKLLVFDDWVMELQRLMPGVPMQVTTPNLIASAEALGRFHVCGAGLPMPPRDRNKWRFSETPFQAFQQLYETARPLGDERQLQKNCDAIAMYLQDAHEALRAEKRSKLETGLIHGDWHVGNLLFDNGALSAILDLEFAGEGCFLEDIAYALSNLCIRTTKVPEKMKHRTNLLLDTYQRQRSLSIFELLALYYAVGVKQVTAVAYQIQQQGRAAGYDAAEWMQRLAAQCAWLEEQARRIRFGH